MSGARFTAWFSEDERAAIRGLAVHNRCSENFVIRTALRAMVFREPVPTSFRSNASNTNNAHEGAQR